MAKEMLERCEMSYMPCQVRNVFDFIDDDTKWFIVGGPADGTEGQEVKNAFPHVKIVGYEPDVASVKWQLENGFPGDVHQLALWSENTILPLTVPGVNTDDPHQPHRMSSVVHFEATKSSCNVAARTLDSLSNDHGPFENAFLWIDIEESELECLKGAVNLLSTGFISAINAEVLRIHEKAIADFLWQYGYTEAKRWGCKTPSPGREMCDIVYARENR